MSLSRREAILLAFVGLGSVGSLAPASAQTPEEFYTGKTLTMLDATPLLRAYAAWRLRRLARQDAVQEQQQLLLGLLRV